MLQETEKPLLAPEFVHKEQLSNGLEIFVHEMPWAQSTTAHLFIKAGPRYEAGSTLGSAHYLEHWLPDGTNKYNNFQDVEEAAESRGGRQHESTGSEYVNYWSKLPVKHSSFATELLGEIVFKPLLRDEDFERERGIIEQEILTHIDTPSRYCWTLVARQMWGGHPFGEGFSILGTLETVRGMRKTDLIDHYRRFYQPSNTTLVIAGNVDTNTAVNYARRDFGNLPNEFLPTEPPITHLYDPESKVLVEPKDINQAHLRLAFTTEGHGSKSNLYYPALIINFMLHKNAYHTIVTKLGLAYSAWSSPWIHSDSGLIVVGSQISPDKVLEVTRELVSLVNTLPLTDERVKTTKEALKGSLTLGLADTEQFTEFIGEQYVEKKQILSPDQVCQAVDSVTLEELREVKNALFTNKNVGAVVYGPAPENVAVEIERLLEFE